jgi:hypothetical protein
MTAFSKDAQSQSDNLAVRLSAIPLLQKLDGSFVISVKPKAFAFQDHSIL